MVEEPPHIPVEEPVQGDPPDDVFNFIIFKASREKQQIAIHGPSLDDAKPCDKIPTIENEMVLKTLEKLGKYSYDPE